MTYKAAVIGCGRMGAFPSEKMVDHAPDHFKPFSHAQAVVMHERLELAALCDGAQQLLEDAGAKYGCKSLFSDHAEMLSTIAPDLVCVATRAPGRAGLIGEIADSGVRALHVEKPLCNSMAELTKLEEIFACDAMFVTLGAARRHFPVFAHAVELAHGGAYGEPLEIRVTMGGQPLYWTHPHSVDLILFAARGRPTESVQARLAGVDPLGDGKGISNDPAILSATVYFEGGLIGHIGRPPGFEFRIGCEKARISILQDGCRFELAQFGDGSPYLQTEVLDRPEWRGPQGIFAPIRQLVSCLEGDEDALAANHRVKDDIIRGQKILFAIAWSHLNGGCPVSLDDVPEDFRIEGRTGALFA